MTGYTRADSVNNIADGNIINASDLDGEFDAVQAAFNSSTGHVHDGTAANGAPITKIGPTQDVVASATALTPKTTATVDVGSSSLKFKDFFYSGAGSVIGIITAGGFSGPLNGTVGATTPAAGTFTAVTNSALTSGRVVYSTSGGLETDSANLTFNGTTLSTAGLSDSGNLTFTGTGNRILGDFSNATVASRVAFQTSTVNGNTNINVLPNGTSTISGFNAFDNSDPTNAAIAQLLVVSSTASVRSAITGTGTYLPMTFYTGGSERMRIVGGTGTDVGYVGIGVTNPANRLSLPNANYLGWRNSTNTGETAGILVNASNNLVLYNAGDRVTIDSSGNVGIGTNAISGLSLRISKSLTPGTDSGATDSYGVRVDGNIPSSVTGSARLFSTYPSTSATAFTVSTLAHYTAGQGALGAGSSVTSQNGFYVDASMVGGTNNSGLIVADIGGASATTGKSNIAFYSAVSAASGGGSAWNIYMAGSAPNYFAGKVGIGTSSPGDKLEVTSSTQNIVVSRSTGSYAAFQRTAPTGQQTYDFYTINGVEVARITGDPSFLAFSTGSSATERMRIDSSSGNVLVTSAAGLGYGTGSGGTVTQATSKSTGVTLNKPTGRITTAADALLPTGVVSFTFTNSLITATDNVIFTFSDGNGYQYNIWAYNIGAGSCSVALQNITAGSLSQALPVNFAIIKGATS